MTDPAQPSSSPPGWTPPAAPPFGAPVGPAAGAPAPRPGQPQQPAGPPYAPPYGPPGARYAPPVYGGAPVRPAAAPRRSPVVGVVALIAGLLAALGASLAGGIAAYRIGFGTGSATLTQPFAGDFDWSVLSPVRDAVLAGELSFWIGTLLGLWALVQGLIAIVRGTGRGFGIAAVALAALGPVVFFTTVQIALTLGRATSGFTGWFQPFRRRPAAPARRSAAVRGHSCPDGTLDLPMSPLKAWTWFRNTRRRRGLRP